MPQSHDNCIHEDDFKRLEGLVSKVFSKMDKFLEEMRDMMVSEAARQEKLIRLEKDLNDLGAKLRSQNNRIQTLNDWKQRFEGGIKVMMAIPVFCSILTTGVALYTLLT